MPSRKIPKSEQSPLKLLLWTALAALIFGLIGFGEYAEDSLRVGRNALHRHKASGDIVLVRIDDAAMRDVGRWPWPRQHHAELTDRISAAGAKRIFFDIAFFGPTDPAQDELLAQSFKRSARVVLPIKARSGTDRNGNDPRGSVTPLPILSQHAQLGAISVRYNYQNAAWRIPYSLPSDGKEVRSFAALLADAPAAAGEMFIPDYSIDTTTIPTVSAAALLKGQVPASRLAGKDVVIGTDSEAAGDQYFVPGTGKIGGVYIQIIGAETLKRGTPVYLGWLPGLLLALAAATATLRSRKRLHRTALLGGATLTLLALPILLETRLIFADITPGLFAIGIVSTALFRRGLRSQGLVNLLSGLPNLAALRANKAGRQQALITARVFNYAEIVATLPADRERQLIEQIVARLTLGAPDRTLYHGDGGIFAWFEDTRQPFGHHLEALYSLFRPAARIGDLTIDVAIAFGVELGSRRSLGNRLASAVLAAEEAAHDGLKWKCHDPDSLENASWKLSILSQLDDAVDKGQVWVAYQPKLDLATRRIVGAEALARWTHPEKGPIAASEFIAAAEQHDRIAKLTDFVLDHAIAAAASVRRRDPHFNMSVNLSARLLVDQGFKLRLAAMLARHKVPAHALTLELTETAALTGNGAALDLLVALRDMGITISIDDYGTGLSTLDYLKKIPASEIKIDQSFVRGMLDNRSDRLMVQSTVGLAHELGRRVVAEGVERREILDALIDMNCDIAQGFIVGRPMSLESLMKRLGSRQQAKTG